jgi:hypothetical protein
MFVSFSKLNIASIIIFIFTFLNQKPPIPQGGLKKIWIKVPSALLCRSGYAKAEVDLGVK